MEWKNTIRNREQFFFVKVVAISATLLEKLR